MQMIEFGAVMAVTLKRVRSFLVLVQVCTFFFYLFFFFFFFLQRATLSLDLGQELLDNSAGLSSSTSKKNQR